MRLATVPTLAAFLFLCLSHAAAQTPELFIQRGHADTVNAVAFGPDGKTYASASRDGTLRLWDAATGAELRSVAAHAGGVQFLAFRPGASQVLTGGADRTLKLWDADTLALRKERADFSPAAVAYSPDGRTLAAAENAGGVAVALLDPETLAEVRRLPVKLDYIEFMAVGPGAKIVAVASEQSISLIDAATGAELRQLKGHTDAVNALDFSPDGQTLASGSEDGTVRLWDVAAGRGVLTYEGRSGDVYAVRFAPDGARLASGGYAGGVKVWEARTGATVATLRTPRNCFVRSLAFSPDGRALVAGTSIDDAVLVWDTQGGRLLHDAAPRAAIIAALAFAPDGRTLYAGRPERPLAVWDLTRGAMRAFNDVREGFATFSLSPDGRTVASRREAEGGMALSLWDAATGTEKLKLPPRVWSSQFPFSPDGKLVAASTREEEKGQAAYPINLWDAQSGALARKLKGYATAHAQALAFSPDGRVLATAQAPHSKSDHTVRLWDVQTGAELRALSGHEYPIPSVAFSHDGKLLASAGGLEKTVRVWDAATGAQARALEGHRQPVLCVAFSPDGRLIASGATASSIRGEKGVRAELKLWDAASGRVLFDLAGHALDVRAVAFGPDAKTLASAGGDGAVKLWDVTSGRELATLHLLNDADWIVTTPAGRFDASASARPFLLWRYGAKLRDVVPVDALSAEFESAGLLTAALSGKPLPEPRALAAEEIARAVEGFRAGRAGEEAKREEKKREETRAAAPSDDRPRLFVQTGHVGSILALAYSPEGKVFASASGDQTVRLWDAASGRELRQLTGFSFGDSFYPTRLFFTRDGKTLIAGDADNVSVWDVETGALRQKFEKHRAPALSRDGEVVAMLAGYKITLRRARTGEPVREFELGFEDGRTTSDLAFTPDGQMLASFSERGVTLRHPESGKPARTIGAGAVRGRMAFSPDGRALATLQDNSVRLWDAQTGASLRSFTPQKVKAEYGAEVFDNALYGFAFSPDGHALALATLHGLEVWRVSDGRPVRALPDKRFTARFDAVAFSQDGRRLAAGGLNGIYWWDAEGGAEVAHFTQATTDLGQLAFSPDGQLMATGGKAAKLWDLRAGAVARGYKGLFGTLAFMPDSKSLVNGFMGVGRINFVTGATEDLNAKNGGLWQPHFIALSPDGKLVAGPGDVDYSGQQPDNSLVGKIRVVSTETNRAVRLLDHHALALAFSPDSKLLASVGVETKDGRAAQTIKLWDVADGKVARTFSASATSPVRALAFNPRGGQLASGGLDKTVTLWNLQDGTARMLAAGDYVNHIAFSSDGRTVAAALDDGVKLWDAEGGAELRTLRGHVGDVQTIAFTPDNKLLVSIGEDETAKLWDAQTGEELASLFTVGADDWLVATPDGLFDGTPDAFGRVQWRFSPALFDVAPVEWFFQDYFRPGLLAELFAGERPRAAQSVARRDRRQPRLTLSAAGAQPAAEVAERRARLRIEIGDAPAGARDVRLFRNGSLVKAWRGDAAAATLEAEVTLVAGDNNFAAYAFNRDNVKSADARLTVRGAKSLERKGVMHVIAVGVNEYADASFNLKYAVADARLFGEELKRQQESLRQYERVEVTPLEDRAATKANILKALAELAARSQPEDAVVFYFAGHGAARSDRFFLIPHDFANAGAGVSSIATESLAARGLSDRELEQALEGVDARHLLLVIDACNSGQALEAEEKRRGPMNSKGLAQLAYEKGMYVLTASQSFQAALEVSQLGHGLLTYALVEEGLRRMAADAAPRDGSLMAREWLAFAEQRVPAMQLDKLQQAQGTGRDLSFSEAERGLPLARRAGQRPRVFYRREPEARPLVVAKQGAGN